MKRLRAVKDVVQTASSVPVFPFLAPAIHSGALSPAHRSTSCPAQSLHASLSRCLSSSLLSRASSAQAARAAEKPEDSQPANTNARASTRNHSRPTDAEGQMLRDLLARDRDSSSATNARTRTRDFWKSKETPLPLGDYTSPARKNRQDAEANKVSTSMANAKFDSVLRKAEEADRARANRRSALHSPLGVARAPPGLDALDAPELAVRSHANMAESELRIDPYMGRSVPVKPGYTLAAAIRRLDQKLQANRIRADMFKQRFHERPGLKRKRLKSERWRKRFKEGFVAMVQQVKEMRDKGW